MTTLEKEVYGMKHELALIKEALETITDENFTACLRDVDKRLHKLRELSIDMKSRFTKDELQLFDPEMKKVTKEIQKIFDSLVQEKKIELQSVSSQLQVVNNQKKLTNYLG